MPPVRIKICGLTREDEARAVAGLGADAVGFVFWPRSPRYVAPETVGSWIADWPAGTLRVGVFVNETPADVARIMRAARLDVAQLHGREPPEDCAGLPGAVWKMIPLDGSAAHPPAAYPVDAYLLDRYDPALPGGSGRTVDWSRAAAFVRAADKPVALAGGLRPENIRAALEQVRPWAVDVSSGVEIAPGRKDMERVKAFIELCRAN